MLSLPNVTFIAVDDVNPYRCLGVVDEVSKVITFNSIKVLTSFDVENTIRIPPVFSIQAYNIFIAHHLKDYIDTDYCMIFQWDGYPVNPKAWDDQFLQYDYIGAPWLVQSLPTEYRVGNGGFSLRSKKFLQATSTIEYDGGIGEDLFFCRTAIRKLLIENHHIKFAPYELAYKFSIENAPYSGSFGFHGLRTMILSRKAGTFK